MRARRVLVAAAVWLAACAQLPQSPEGAYEFEMTARFAARYRDEAASGLLAWRHRATADDVLLSSSFGQGLARITREGDAVVLVAGDDRRYAAADAETLTEEVLGFRLPLRGLADWVRARPAADAPARTEYAQDGRLLWLEQHGWRVEYLAFESARPTRLKLNYPGLELRLAIGEWK
jgi:outer membrane lipoprotein LolB